MSPRKEPEPLEREGYCQGCGRFCHLYLVALSRYRCAECSMKEK